MFDRMHTPEAAAYLGISASTLSKRRVFGDGPSYHKLGKRVVYQRSDLDAWLAKNKYASTSEYSEESDVS